MNTLKSLVVMLAILIAPLFNQAKAQAPSAEQLAQVMAEVLNAPEIVEQVYANGDVSNWSARSEGVNVVCDVTITEPIINIKTLSASEWEYAANEMGSEFMKGVTGNKTPELEMVLSILRNAGTKFVFNFTDFHGNKGSVAIPI